MKYENKLLILCRGLYPPSRTVRQRHLDEFKPFPFLGINNITVPVKKGSIWYGWLTSENTSFKNDSITYFNDSVDKSILDGEVNVCGIIAIVIIESNFDNDNIHMLHDLTKRYIYIYFISKLINSEATIQNMIFKKYVYYWF